MRAFPSNWKESLETSLSGSYVSLATQGRAADTLSHKIHSPGSKTSRSAERCSLRSLQRISASPNSYIVQEILDTGGMQSQQVNLWLIMVNLDCQDWLQNQPRDMLLDGSVTAFPKRINRRGLRREGPPQSVFGGGMFFNSRPDMRRSKKQQHRISRPCFLLVSVPTL